DLPRYGSTDHPEDQPGYGRSDQPYSSGYDSAYGSQGYSGAQFGGPGYSEQPYYGANPHDNLVATNGKLQIFNAIGFGFKRTFSNAKLWLLGSVAFIATAWHWKMCAAVAVGLCRFYCLYDGPGRNRRCIDRLWFRTFSGRSGYHRQLLKPDFTIAHAIYLPFGDQRSRFACYRVVYDRQRRSLLADYCHHHYFVADWPGLFIHFRRSSPQRALS